MLVLKFLPKRCRLLRMQKEKISHEGSSLCDSTALQNVLRQGGLKTAKL